MKLYTKWVDKNIGKINGDIAIVTGADGSIGYFITYYLVYLGAKVVMAVRDTNKASKLKEKILKTIPNAVIYIEYLDLFNLKCIKEASINLKKYNPKYIINNAGIYHLPSLKNEDGIERTFCVNFFGPYLLNKELLEIIKKNNGKIINQCSVSTCWVNTKEIDFSDLNLTKENNLTQKYAKTKIMMLLATIFGKEKGIDMVLVHPGASATSLFSSTRGGFSKLFNMLVLPLMKVIFISPSKASLSAIYSINHDTKINEWIGPRGLFNIWGYPKISKLEKKFLDENLKNNFIKNLNEFEKEFN